MNISETQCENLHGIYMVSRHRRGTIFFVADIPRCEGEQFMNRLSWSRIAIVGSKTGIDAVKRTGPVKALSVLLWMSAAGTGGFQ